LAKSLENLTFFGSKCPKLPKYDQFLGKSTGSRPISAGSQLIFQKFQGFTRFVTKSFENWPFFLEKSPEVS